MENKIYNHPYFGEIYYLIDVPEKIKNAENVPMLVFLHGAGERGQDHELLKKQAVPKYISEGSMKPESYITVCPQCPCEYVWVNMAAMLKDFLEYIISEYRIDRNRISLTGISMGGYGTWEMSMLYPDMFRKIAPVCGGGTPWRANLIKADIWTFHGDADPVVPIQNTYMMVGAVKANGKDIKCTVFHGVGHASWDAAYEDTKVIDWLMDI